MDKDNCKVIKFMLGIILLMSSNVIYAEGSVSFSILSGSKNLTSDWGLFSSQTESGFIVEVQAPEWPVALVTSILSSKKSISVPDVKVTGSTMEVGIGVRKYLIKKRVGFFMEGGLAWIVAEAELEYSGEAMSVSDSATGFWYGAGADVMIGDLLSVGLLGRVSDATLTSGDSDLDIGGRHFSSGSFLKIGIVFYDCFSVNSF